MSTNKNLMTELMKADLYGMLGVEHTAGEKAIKQAYRKTALKCHPDKNPDDPKAAELFLKLSKALEILCDADARKTYDHLLKARQAAALRNRELDSKRKRLKEDLEARERAAETNKVDIQKDMAKLQAEIERLRKQGSRMLEEEQELMREELKKEKEGRHVEDSDGCDGCRLKVRWKGSHGVEGTEGYDHDKLISIFSKYGEVAAIVVSKKKKGSALVEFSDPRAALRASQFERGLAGCPLTVDLIGARQSEVKPTTGMASSSSEPPLSQSSFDTFESLVLRNLRQAQERKKLLEEIKSEDS
ncbi:dnaJ homolog subfamily C member 17-like [Pollicipes pollicipes]|uniref:dnaJ homolog subfamily C member 17-like n=1 Tax=Pollicipes pollicipes TaxID=41117 RepID=UPI0018857CA8|nr:dnaJ homolog subfamily C member 17-like [Pollicipes pollicipes]